MSNIEFDADNAQRPVAHFYRYSPQQKPRKGLLGLSSNVLIAIIVIAIGTSLYLLRGQISMDNRDRVGNLEDLYTLYGQPR